MSKDKGRSKKNKEFELDVYKGDSNVVEEELSLACTDSMQVFFANTNLMRQIANLIDGLKPVQRRILVAMYNMGLRPGGKPVKSVSIVAKTMDEYHPHGDSSIYGSLVSFAQWWSTRFVMADPKSNFGGQSGEPAAAFRYTETTFTRFAWDAYFTEYSLDNVMTKPTYTRKSLEPEYLPAKYPMALLLGCFGIGQGIQVGIPSFRPDQVFDLAIELLENPKFDDPLIMPDSLTYCDIVDEGNFEEICRTGKGTIKYRANLELDHDNNVILIRSLPPQVTMDKVKEKIVELHESGAIKGYLDTFSRPEVSLCKEDGAAGLIVKFRKEVDINEIANILYKHAGLTKTMHINFVYLDNYKEVSYGTLDYMREWLEYRREFKQIDFSKKMIKTVEELHNLDTILMIFDGKNAEKALKVARNSTRDVLEEYLMKEFKISSLQAKAISKMSISAFAKDNIEKLKKEYEELEKYRDEIKKLLSNPKKIDKIIKKELLEGKEKYGNDVRSRIIKIDGEESVANTRHMVVFTKGGYVKKLAHDAKTIGHIETGDNPTEVCFCDNREDIMVFTSTGKVFKLPVSSIPNTLPEEPGNAVSDFIKIKGSIKAIIPKPSKKLVIEPNTQFIVMITANGVIKKTDVTNFQNMRNELAAMTIEKGDELVDVKVMLGEQEVLVYTDAGMGVRYSAEEVRETGRAAKGISGIAKDDFEKVKGFDIVSPKDKYILCFTSKGKAKKCDLDNFRTMKRTSKPLRIITLDEGEDIVLIKTIKGKEELVVFMKSEVYRIDAREIDVLSRMAKGVKKIGVRKGDEIIDVRVD